MILPLALHNVTKTYRRKKNPPVKALDTVSLEIYPGEIFGLLGPNGAGKTTLINSVIGLLPFDQGNITVFGHDVVKEYVLTRSKIGFVFQELALDNFFGLNRYLQFHQGLNNVSPSSEIADDILRKLDLWEYQGLLPEQLSGGLKRRFSVAKALVHQPSFVILDEPTAGVDIESRDKMWEVIRDINKKGTTILLTTHHLEEAETMCDRVGIINHGKFKTIEHTQELVSKMGQRLMYVCTSQEIPAINMKQCPFKYALYENPKKELFKYEVFIGRGFDEVDRCLHWFRAQDVKIQEVSIQQPTLEKVFRQIAWGNSL